MIACAWVFIYGIFFTSVDCELGIAPQDQEPLTRLLKRTINHVKSFLGEFERKIKDSRLIVREIHNQSLLSNNRSTVAINDINTIPQPVTINQDLDVFEEAIATTTGRLNFRFANAGTIRSDNEIMSNSPAVYPSPNVNLIVAQRRATTAQSPKRSIYQSPTRFRMEADFNSKHQTEVFFPGTSGVKANDTFTKHPIRLMRQGPARFQSKEEKVENKFHRINPNDFYKGFRYFMNSTEYPKRLMRQGSTKFQRGEGRLIYPRVFAGGKRINITTTKYTNVTLSKYTNVTLYKHIDTTKYSNQVTREDTLRNQSKAKAIVFRGGEIVKPTRKWMPDPQAQHTLSRFYFRLKEDVFSEPVQEYPDIFLRGANRNTTGAIVTTPQFLTSETVAETIGGVIPELTKDYLNINFRAQSSEEDNSPVPLYSQTLNNSSNRVLNEHESLKENLSHKSKPLVPKNGYSTKTSKDTRGEIANEKLRKIIAPSSYSLSDEETYLKMNLLDQLYHYNKTVHEDDIDKT